MLFFLRFLVIALRFRVSRWWFPLSIVFVGVAGVLLLLSASLSSPVSAQSPTSTPNPYHNHWWARVETYCSAGGGYTWQDYDLGGGPTAEFDFWDSTASCPTGGATTWNAYISSPRWVKTFDVAGTIGGGRDSLVLPTIMMYCGSSSVWYGHIYNCSYALPDWPVWPEPLFPQERTGVGAYQITKNQGGVNGWGDEISPIWYDPRWSAGSRPLWQVSLYNWSGDAASHAWIHLFADSSPYPDDNVENPDLVSYTPTPAVSPTPSPTGGTPTPEWCSLVTPPPGGWVCGNACFVGPCAPTPTPAIDCPPYPAWMCAWKAPTVAPWPTQVPYPTQLPYPTFPPWPTAIPWPSPTVGPTVTPVPPILVITEPTQYGCYELLPVITIDDTFVGQAVDFHFVGLNVCLAEYTYDINFMGFAFGGLLTAGAAALLLFTIWSFFRG